MFTLDLHGDSNTVYRGVWLLSELCYDTIIFCAIILRTETHSQRENTVTTSPTLCVLTIDGRRASLSVLRFLLDLDNCIAHSLFLSYRWPDNLAGGDGTEVNTVNVTCTRWKTGALVQTRACVAIPT